MKRRPRVLYVAPVEPWCRENGSSLITADLLDGLAAIDAVELLAVFVRPPPAGYARVPPDGLEGVLLDIPGLPRWISVLRAAVGWSSPLRHRFDNGRVARRIGSVLNERRFRPDLIHVEHLPLVDVGLKVAGLADRPLVYRAHNIESSLWARRLGLPRVFKVPVVAHMERQEANAVRAADLTLCISDVDLAWVRKSAPGVRAELLPCTLRLDRYDAVPRKEPVFEAQMCFVGGLDWAPNEDGLRWFVQNVLPTVAQSAPGAGLAVLARGATERPWLRDHPRVHILAAEASAAELFASSHVSIAPLFQGGGVRIKIPESLALGCPVVATTIGAEGHELHGLTRTDDPVDFAAACVRHLSLKGRPGQDRALRTGVEERYGARVQADRLVALWDRTMSGRGAASSSSVG